MRKALFCMSALALVSTLSACGSNDTAENNIAAEDVNALMNLEEPLPAEPAANVAVEPPATEPAPSTPAAKPAEPKPAPPKPKAPAPEPAPDPHAGHDMNNMQH